MNPLRKSAAWALPVALLGAAVLGYLFWHWVVCRVEVPPGHFLVRIHLWGHDLPEGEILAPDGSYKGVMNEELPEGRYFLNPLAWTYSIHPIVHVPPGQCLVRTRKFGREIPGDRIARGDVLAGPDERGILRDVLLQGNHRVNPYAYDQALVPAVEVRAEQVGVRTLKVGKDPSELKRDAKRSPYVVPEGYRGVQEKPVPPGTYYLNPHAESIVPVDVRSHRVEFTDIEFPSRDGFALKPHVLVTYRVLPVKAPELFVTLTDEGVLHQDDAASPRDQERNEILQKVLLPLIRGYVRIEGSKFDARDFISATAVPGEAQAINPRERLQQEVLDKVGARCQREGIAIESVTIAQMEPPPDLKALITEREQARVTREKNVDKIGQYKEEQELKANEALKQQQSEMVSAEKRLVQAQALADQRKKVEESRLKQELASARLRLEAAKDRARALVAAGRAEADVINLQNDAEVSGLRKAVGGFPSPEHFAQYHVLSKLAPALTEIFASDGSDFAKLFSAYMTPPARANVAGATPAAGGATAAAKK